MIIPKRRLLTAPILLALILAIVPTQTGCDPASMVKLADRAASVTPKFAPVFQSLCDGGQGWACAAVKRADQFSTTTKALADAFRNKSGDVLSMAHTSIGVLEALIEDTKLIKDLGKRTLALSFLAIADIALGEIAAALSKDADANPGIAAMAAAGNPDAVAAIAKFAKKKRLRCRNSITGRFEKMEVCQKNPQSTVVEPGRN